MSIEEDDDLTGIADRAIAVLEMADQPLYAWDIHREIEKRWDEATNPASVLSVLGTDSRACWAGPNLYGLYRHGLLPAVRELGAVGGIYLHAAGRPLRVEELRFVMRHNGYRFAATSLPLAITNNEGRGIYRWDSWGFWASKRESIPRQRAAARALGLGRRGPDFEKIMERTEKQVEGALAERERRLGGLERGGIENSRQDTAPRTARARLNPRNAEDLQPGKVYDWDELGEVFDFIPDYLGAVGGMVSRPKQNALLLMTHPDGAKSIDYGDEWDGEDLIYTGRGKRGNQERTGQNRDLGDNRRDVYVFEPAGPRELMFRGNARTVDEWTERQPDEVGEERDVLRFRLRFEAPTARA